MTKSKLPLLLVSSLFFSACIFQSPPKSAPAPDTSAQALTPIEPTTTTTSGSSQTDTNVKEITLTAKRFSFEPSSITVPLGTKVRLVVTALDAGHGLAIPAFNISQELPVGNTTIEFTADKIGKFPFSCNIICGSGHKDMTGTLIVE